MRRRRAGKGAQEREGGRERGGTAEAANRAHQWTGERLASPHPESRPTAFAMAGEPENRPAAFAVPASTST